MTERLFFAIWPGDEQRSALARIQRELPDRHGRKTHPEDLHITLVFLGDVGADQRGCAEAAADQAHGVPFELTFDSIGCFPRARVLWCGASILPDPLLKLARGLNRHLLGCGFPPERRPYAPHVTLARKARPIEAKSLTQPIQWPVSEFVLVVAREGPAPRYQVLRRWRLAS
ncbi:MAG: RNA 2',3'-cyclic phosphodiesterase [Pseudomonadota bacterium]|nr:RNA 2',3'-cyclic phosphodiesterase [Pseudomonadota bacterium]